MKKHLLLIVTPLVLVLCLTSLTAARVKSVEITGRADWSSPNYQGKYGPTSG